MVMGLIGILAKMSYIPTAEEEVKKLVKFLAEKSSLYSVDREVTINPAKKDISIESGVVTAKYT